MPVMDVEETLTFISDTCSTSEWSSIKFLCTNGLISNLTMTSNSRYDHHNQIMNIIDVPNIGTS